MINEQLAERAKILLLQKKEIKYFKMDLIVVNFHNKNIF
jgi:hypothetical protein